MTLTEKPRTTAAPLLFSSRLGLALAGCLGIILIYASRINLSVAIVCMVNKTAAEDHTKNASKSVVQECGHVDQNKSSGFEIEGEFNWNTDIRGIVLSAFFYGYMATQILGGLAAQWIGAKRILGACMFCTFLLTVLTPAGSRSSYGVLVAIRILIGVSQGVVFPAFHVMWSHWAPPLERSILTGVTYAGSQLGNVITLPLSAMLCRYGFAGGWPSIFYVIGLACFAWFVGWMFYVSDTPNGHRRISADERRYINLAIHDSTSGMVEDEKTGIEKMKVPWLKVATSLPFWAIVVGHFAGDWGAYMMLTCLPAFLNEALGLDITTLGFVSSLPYILYFACINLGGFLSDHLRQNGILSTLNTRRLMMAIALGSQATLLVAASYCGCGQDSLAIALVTIGTGLSGFQYAGYLVNYIDIAPKYSGPTLGVGNTISCLSGVLGPAAMGIMTRSKTKSSWRNLFWLNFGVMMAGLLFYLLFASGEVQAWAREDEHDGLMMPAEVELEEMPTDRTDLDGGRDGKNGGKGVLA